MGMVSPLGLDVESTWQALIAGRSGVDMITLFDAEGYDTRFAAEVKGFDPAQYIDRKEVRRLDRFTHFALAAALQAVEQANLKIGPHNANEIGVLIGSGIGGLSTLFEQFKVLVERGPGRVSPFLVPMMISDTASGQVSITLGAKGPNWGTVSSCSTGAHALGEAFETIRRGDAQAMIAGGSEAPITPIAIAAFNAARALSTRNDRPQQASRPFAADRDGFVIGEGAAVLVLESLEFALGRGASIIAEMVGYGATGDAFHITAPAEGGEGGYRAMKIALHKAGLAPSEIDYINAHGTSTPLNDRTETQAIKALFGEHAYKVAISSTKSMIGHLLGAAGAVEAAFSVLAIQRGVLPPTINLDSPDPECDLDYVPHSARRQRVRATMSNAFGFGGHNAVLAFKEFAS
jgi:3-oxoacyl-[acyl-carrier-protein] synthase II